MKEVNISVPKQYPLFRASSVGNLMAGTIGLTEKQTAYLAELQERDQLSAVGQAKPLTEKMKATVAELIEKRDAPAELGETAKSLVRKMWLQEEYDFREVMYSKETMKGHLCEQDSLALISEIWPEDEFRIKNTRRLEGLNLAGTPDVLLKTVETVEDAKTPWSIRTYFDVKEPPELYYAQGQVYMYLSEFTKFRLHYCLVNTPVELVAAEEARLFHKFGRSDDSDSYQEAIEQIRINHEYDHIPAELRIKTFEFDYDSAYMDELQGRIELAYKYYDTLTLNGIRSQKWNPEKS